jgi:class 3 adenylate cyclase
MEWKIEVENLRTRELMTFSVPKDRISLGRNEGNDIVIPNLYVSRLHLEVFEQNGSYFIEDKSSANGSLIRHGARWEPLKGVVAVDLPVFLVIGKEMSVHIWTEASANKAATSIIKSDAFKTSLSQVYSIKELAREEAILVLDICDSTEMASTDETMAFHLKRRLESIARPAFYHNSVTFVKSTGDGFLACFGSCTDSFRAAKAIISGLDYRNRSTNNPPIHVRISLHWGKTYAIDSETGDVHGRDVNIAFRIDGLTDDAFENLERELPSRDRVLCTTYYLDKLTSEAIINRTDFICCGHAHLKGINELFEIHCLEI